jgi:hypothetical protein
MCVVSDGVLGLQNNFAATLTQGKSTTGNRRGQDARVRTLEHQFNTVLSKNFRRGLLDTGDFERLSDGMEFI